MKQAKHSKRAFTLIELLIVIAIIAILALIAIPNFLEAQTRSKVARAQADMRSIATALEAYFVDNNSYPLLNRKDSILGGSKQRARYAAFLWIEKQGFETTDTSGDLYVAANAKPLTTPVAYISTIPRDPFNIIEEGLGINEDFHDQSFFFYNHKSAADDCAAGLYGAWNGSGFSPFDPPLVAPTPMRFNGPDGPTKRCYWAMLSAGPDRRISDSANNILLTWHQSHYENMLDGSLTDYDPTNGTTSYGNIWRLQGD